VREIINDPVSRTMVDAINQVGHVMNLQTIAEYVETDEIKMALAELNIDYGQGYGLARPCSFIEFLENRT
ncbi:MAG: EAL domain-containing protein, partial [Gammaproteobacteria bacterium]|nr:EAL domain-containing protein [Gammaproteobacteria bacterium]